MTENEINTAVFEFGLPRYIETDDTESGYWQFSDTDQFQADSFGQLLSAGVSVLSIQAKMKRLNDDSKYSAIAQEHDMGYE